MKRGGIDVCDAGILEVIRQSAQVGIVSHASFDELNNILSHLVLHGSVILGQGLNDVAVVIGNDGKQVPAYIVIVHEIVFSSTHMRRMQLIIALKLDCKLDNELDDGVCDMRRGKRTRVEGDERHVLCPDYQTQLS